MKKFPSMYFLIALTVAICTACEGKGGYPEPPESPQTPPQQPKPEPEYYSITTDFRIINNIKSPVVVELTKVGDGQEMTIPPRDTLILHRTEYLCPAGAACDFPEPLGGRMQIDGEVMPASIWRIDLWDCESSGSVGEDHYSMLTLTVTDERLEIHRNDQLHLITPSLKFIR